MKIEYNIQKNYYELTKDGEILALSDSPTQLRELGLMISGKLAAAELANNQLQDLISIIPYNIPFKV